METTLARVLLELLQKGMTPSETVKSLASILEKSGRTGLFPKVARAFDRLVQAQNHREQSVLFVAKGSDAKKAEKDSGAEDHVVKIDPTLIGGWKLQKGDMLTDVSWKKHLLSMYNRIAH